MNRPYFVFFVTFVVKCPFLFWFVVRRLKTNPLRLCR
jgi:hypothetical protein